MKTWMAFWEYMLGLAVNFLIIPNSIRDWIRLWIAVTDRSSFSASSRYERRELASNSWHNITSILSKITHQPLLCYLLLNCFNSHKPKSPKDSWFSGLSRYPDHHHANYLVSNLKYLYMNKNGSSRKGTNKLPTTYFYSPHQKWAPIKTDSTEERKKHKSCTYDDRVLPNYGTGGARAKFPCRENLAKVGNAQQWS